MRFPVPARRLIVAATLITLAACGGDDDNGGGTHTCTLATQPSTISGTATYTATGTGNGAISQVRYQSETGTVTENNPILPWTKVEVLTTAKASLQATGTVGTGSLTIRYSVQQSGSGAGTAEQGEDGCAF